MSPKAVKITDIKGPDKVAPATTSRPLLVTNRPVIADPMMVKKPEPVDDNVSSETVKRTVKVIKPMTLRGNDVASSDPLEITTDRAEPERTSEIPNDSNKPALSDSAANSKPLSLDQESVPTSEPEQGATEAEAERAKAQLAEAEVARQQELDVLIASGKYVVPIGAAQRHRSRVYVTILCAVGLLLAVLLLDVLLDAGIIKLSTNVPHTHFFTTN